LQELKVLDNHTVLIHGLAFSDKDIQNIADSGANVVWCPSSNYFMFKETTNIKLMLERGVNVSLGTDSPMSGGMNILEEMQFAWKLYRQLYNEYLDYKKIVQMVTSNPAKAFRLKEQGKLEAGFTADILVIQNKDPQKPYESLVNSWLDNIKIVIKDGIPLYGNQEFSRSFKKFKNHYQALKLNGKDRILTGKPLDLYKKIWENVGFKKILPFLPVNY
jgi:cytosine/adenosine deaminase-related metal-dependent hydrolase